MEKPTLPKGTRDFGPATMARRQFIFDNIRKVFQTYGFQPLETPAMENLSTLTGKYGDEGDQLLFKVVNSGDYLEKLKAKEIINLEAFFSSFLTEFTIQYFEKDKNTLVDQQIIKDNLLEFLASKNYIMNVNTSLLDPWKEDIVRNQIVHNSEDFSEILTNLYSASNIRSYHAIANPLDIRFLMGYLKDSDSYILQIEDISNYLISNYPSKKLTPEISEKGLRYDLTVPFARYVVMNRNEVSFPFKRYQIQPVWRADRPQKGRYREFYQCDADVVGTDSLLCEAEIILMIKDVFKRLGIIDYTIKINHRGILSGLAEVVGAAGNETPLFVAIDKLDKIGEEKVKEELRTKGFDDTSLTQVFNILNVKGSTVNKIGYLSTCFEASRAGQKGLRDLQEVFNLLSSYGSDDTHVEFDVALARGLSYYTGCIFEVKINTVAIGSVSGGGRYDNLTKAFGDKENLSGVGFSFGVDRIFDAMQELDLFPKDAQVTSKALVCHFDEESMLYGLGILSKLRAAGIAAEIYPDPSKLKKQLEYAHKKLVPYTLVIGPDEVKSGAVAFKNMVSGVQENLTIDQIIQKLK